MVEKVQALLKRVDRDGQLNTTYLATAPEVEELLQNLPAFQRLVATVTPAARGILVFAVRGWAFSKHSPVPAYEAALARVDEGASLEEAEVALVDGWYDSALLKTLDFDIRTLVPRDDDLFRICSARADLVRAVWEHHQAERYDASVPLSLFQAEGLLRDARQRTPFRPEADLIDDETMAGIEGSLSVAKTWFAESGIKASRVSGRPSRHAIAHGRELGYATRTNSVKALVFLAAVVEFCGPLFQATSSANRSKRESENEGVEGVDAEGRQLDRRGFVEARAALRELARTQTSHLVSAGVFGLPDEVGYVPAPDHPPVDFSLSEDRSLWWAWTRAKTGWVFALADTLLETWEYAGAEPPHAGPLDDPEVWTPESEAPPPDWLDEYPHYRAG